MERLYSKYGPFNTCRHNNIISLVHNIHYVTLRYVALRWDFRTSENIRFSAKNLLTGRKYVRYVCDAGVESESIPTYRALRTRR